MKNLNYAIIILLITSSFINAQNCDNIGKDLVNKIKNTNYKNLLPYYDSTKNKWGLMNKKGIALTEPFDDYPSTFEMNLHNTFNIVNYKGCNININYTDMTFNAEKIEKQNNRYVTQETYGFKTPSSDTLSGFTIEFYSLVDLKTGKIENEGEVSNYSKKFKEVKKPFYKNNKWYALATLQSSSLMGIINQNGQPIPNFNFNYIKLKELEYYKGKFKNEVWYYYEDLSNKKGFVNLAGETILNDELLSECFFL